MGKLLDYFNNPDMLMELLTAEKPEEQVRLTSTTTGQTGKIPVSIWPDENAQEETYKLFAELDRYR